MKTDLIQLNAYVDGELDAAGAAEVARAIANDPQLAARVATLARLKATATKVRSAAVPPPPAFLMAKQPRRAMGVRRAAVAAAVLLTLGFGAAWLALPRLTNRIETAEPSDGLDAALAAHTAWIDSGRSGGAGDRVQIALEARELVRVPDLSAAHLSLTHVSMRGDKAASGGVLLGYVGPNGCRLGLWIADARRAGFGTPLRPISRDGTDMYIWQQGTINYAVLARGMAPARLSLLATSIAALIKRDHHTDDVLSQQLQTAAGQGATCAV